MFTAKRSYIRNTKNGKQLIVPAKQTIAKTIKKQNEKNKAVPEKETYVESESRKA